MTILDDRVGQQTKTQVEIESHKGKVENHFNSVEFEFSFFPFDSSLMHIVSDHSYPYIEVTYHFFSPQHISPTAKIQPHYPCHQML
jgi:hypothetical protein